jgi:hypothetical protein
MKCLWSLSWVVGDTRTPGQDTAKAFSFTNAESRKREVVLIAFMATIAGKATISCLRSDRMWNSTISLVVWCLFWGWPELVLRGVVFWDWPELV